MTRLRSARGGITLGGILTLAVIGFLVYEIAKFGPVLLAQYTFKDSLVEEAKFSRNKKAESIQSALAKRAAELGLPITLDQIRVQREPYKTRIQVQYELSVEWLPRTVYTWTVNEVAESALF